jgi:hypothetical protein
MTEMPMRAPTRRAILAISLLLAGGVPGRAADPVSLRLDWTLSGYHLPFYWAKQKGYYTAENLDVEIKEGAGSGKTVALLAGQQEDIGLADYMFMTQGAAKGMKLKGIFGVVQDGAWAIISHADAPIKKPADLVGKSVATTADHKAMLDLFLDINKIPRDQVRAQVTSPATRNTVFVNGQVDSFISVVIGSPIDLVVRANQGKDKPVHFMQFAQFGIAPWGKACSSTSASWRKSPTCCGASSAPPRVRSTRSRSRRTPTRRSTSPCGSRARATSGASRSSSNGPRRSRACVPPTRRATSTVG